MIRGAEGQGPPLRLDHPAPPRRAGMGGAIRLRDARGIGKDVPAHREADPGHGGDVAGLGDAAEKGWPRGRHSCVGRGAVFPVRANLL